MNVGDLVKHNNTQETFLIISFQCGVFHAVSTKETNLTIVFSPVYNNMSLVSSRK